jgi:hypothetical protein
MAQQSAQSPAKIVRDRHNTDTDERDAWTIPEFCLRHGISRGTYYNIKRLGEGPRETRVRKRVIISRAAAAAWLKQQEKQSA